MHEEKTPNPVEITKVSSVPALGRMIAIDPGTKRCGVAICDELRVITRPLPFIERTSWKKLLSNIKQLVAIYDAKALVIGLPLESDGSESLMSIEARSMARRFTLSLDIPIFLQDERVSTYEAKGRLWQSGKDLKESRRLVDSEAAAIILADFLDTCSDSQP